MRLFATAALLASATLSAGVAHAQDAEIPATAWTFNSAPAQGNQNSQIMDILGDEIEARTKGQITVKRFYGGALWGGPEEVQAITSGLGQGGLLTVPYYNNMFPVFAPGSWLPFGLASGDVAIDLMFHPVLGPMIEKELDAAGLVPLAGSFGPATWFCKEPLPNGVTPDDMSATLRGLRVRAVGTVTAVIERLGGASVSTNIADLPIAVSQGQVDCVFTDWFSWDGLRLYESLPIAYDDGLASFGGTLMVVSKSAFEALPEAGRTAVREAGRAATQKGRELIGERVAEIKARLAQAAGIQIIEVTPEQRSHWAAAAQPIYDDYAAKGADQKLWVDELAKMNAEGYTPSWQR